MSREGRSLEGFLLGNVHRITQKAKALVKFNILLDHKVTAAQIEEHLVREQPRAQSRAGRGCRKVFVICGNVIDVQIEVMFDV